MVLVTLADIDPLLAGFETVPSDGLPFITIDKQRRFYLNATLRKMVDIKAYDRVSLAYNPVEKTLAILTGDAASAIASTNYLVNGRHYMSAIRFCNDYQYDVMKAPYAFEFQRAGSVAGIYLFKLARLSDVGITAEPTEVTPIEVDDTTPTTIKAVIPADVPVVVAPEDVNYDYAPPIKLVNLDESNRLYLEGLESTSVYVKYDVSRSVVHIAFDEMSGSERVNVDSEGMTDVVPAIKKLDIARPATYIYEGKGATDALMFKLAE